MQILLRSFGQRPNLAVWEARDFWLGTSNDPTPRDRRAALERRIAVEAAGAPEVSGPYRRAASAIMRYSIFPPSLVTGVLRREPLQQGDTVGTCYHLMPGVDIFFASRVLVCFDDCKGGVWRTGFTYRTLAGHPIIGEETFSVEKNTATGQVLVALRSWSRPGTWLARATRPIMRWLQFHAGRAALDHLQQLATARATAYHCVS
jgi:uncharacterized protein (UPF0548 family)